ncbi:hypothetical protein V8B97DRAFT_1920207 [Scleroderma yunnanense]
MDGHVLNLAMVIMIVPPFFYTIYRTATIDAFGPVTCAVNPFECKWTLLGTDIWHLVHPCTHWPHLCSLAPSTVSPLTPYNTLTGTSVWYIYVHLLDTLVPSCTLIVVSLTTTMGALPSLFGYQIFAALVLVSSTCNSKDVMTLLL